MEVSLPTKTQNQSHGPNSKAACYVYNKIQDLRESASENFYGRVVAFRPIRKTRGFDLAMNLVVVDDSIAPFIETSEIDAAIATAKIYQLRHAAKQERNTREQPDSMVGYSVQSSHVLHPDALSVSIFKSKEEDFPDIHGIGDIVQFRHFRIKYFDTYKQAISTNWSAFTVFHPPTTKEYFYDFKKWTSSGHHDHLFGTELRIIESLTKPLDDKVFNPILLEPKPINDENFVSLLKTTKRPLLSLEQLKPNIYFDLLAQVYRPVYNMNSIDMSSGNCVTLQVTDYTQNQYIHWESKEDSSLSNAVLTITIWDIHVVEARSLVEGDYVYFSNLHSKLILGNTLQAILHGPKIGEPHRQRIWKLIGNAKDKAQQLFQLNRTKSFDQSKAESHQITVLSTPECSDSAFIGVTEIEGLSKINEEEWVTSIDEIIALDRLVSQKSNQLDDELFNLLPVNLVIKGRVVHVHPNYVEDFFRPFCTTCNHIFNNKTDSSSTISNIITCPSCSQQVINYTIVSSVIIEERFTHKSLPVMVVGNDAYHFYTIGNRPTPNALTYARLKKAREILIQCSLYSLFAIRLLRSPLDGHIFCIMHPATKIVTDC